MHKKRLCHNVMIERNDDKDKHLWLGNYKPLQVNLQGKEISIERDMLVGRDQDAEILLQLKDISRKHAALLFRDDHVWVKDLKSTNGTFVNEWERVEQEQEIELHDGDMLQFANFIFMILAPERYKADLPEIEVEPVAATNHDAGMPTLAEPSCGDFD